MNSDSEKQPWEMTRVEFAESPLTSEFVSETYIANKEKIQLANMYKGKIYKAKPGTKIKGQEVWNHVDLIIAYNLPYKKVIPGFIMPNGEFVYQYPEYSHRLLLEQALSEGKPVPPEVLDEYPDLQKSNPHSVHNPGALFKAMGVEPSVEKQPPSQMVVYRATKARRGVMTDAMPSGIYFFPTRETAELWAGERGEVIERTIDTHKASIQDVPEGGMSRYNRADPTGKSDFDVIIRRDPSGSGKVLEVVVFDESLISRTEEPDLQKTNPHPVHDLGALFKAAGNPHQSSLSSSSRIPSIPPEFKSMAAEARRYETKEEFIKAVEQMGLLDNPFQRLAAATNMLEESRLSSLIETENRWTLEHIFVKSNPQLQPLLKGRVPDQITIYRAGRGEIRVGDWVATTRDYAEKHLREKGDKIYSKTIPSEDLLWAGTDENEWYYAPKRLEGLYEDLESFWQAAQEEPIAANPHPVHNPGALFKALGNP